MLNLTQGSSQREEADSWPDACWVACALGPMSLQDESIHFAAVALRLPSLRLHGASIMMAAAEQLDEIKLECIIVRKVEARPGVGVQVGLEPDEFCKTGSGPAEALKSEPLEPDSLVRDLQADQCVKMALHALRGTSAPRA